VKVIEFQIFYDLEEININNLLFWKKHNFYIACPNATKQIIALALLEA